MRGKVNGYGMSGLSKEGVSGGLFWSMEKGMESVEIRDL